MEQGMEVVFQYMTIVSAAVATGAVMVLFPSYFLYRLIKKTLDKRGW